MPISRSLTKRPSLKNTSNSNTMVNSMTNSNRSNSNRSHSNTMTNSMANSNSNRSTINAEIDTKYSMATGSMIITYIIGLIISVFILNWLIKISKCKCTDLPERRLIPEWFMFRIIWTMILLIYYIANETDMSNTILSIFGVIIAIIDIVMIVRLFIYIRKLKESNCNCGLSKEENVIYYYLIVAFSILVFALLLSILGFSLSL